jgi:hypothetical protein
MIRDLYTGPEALLPLGRVILRDGNEWYLFPHTVPLRILACRWKQSWGHVMYLMCCDLSVMINTTIRKEENVLHIGK